MYIIVESVAHFSTLEYYSLVVSYTLRYKFQQVMSPALL